MTFCLSLVQNQNCSHSVGGSWINFPLQAKHESSGFGVEAVGGISDLQRGQNAQA
jgi:hypothetical protein